MGGLVGSEGKRAGGSRDWWWNLDSTSPKDIKELKEQEHIIRTVPNVAFEDLTNEVARSNTNLVNTIV